MISIFSTKTRNHFRAAKDLDGIETDDLEIDLVLKQHPPEVLPICGKRFVIWYPGIPKQCKNCYELDHIAKTCKNQSITWLEYIARLHQLGQFKDELFGSWIDTLKLHHPSYNNQVQANPQDLRNEIQYNRQGLQQHDLRRQIGPNPDSDNRTRIGYTNDHQNQRGSRGNRGRNRGRGRSNYRGNQHYQPDQYHQPEQYRQPDRYHQPEYQADQGYQQPRGRGRYQRRPYRGNYY